VVLFGEKRRRNDEIAESAKSKENDERGEWQIMSGKIRGE
jgi:hypothetical protein